MPDIFGGRFYPNGMNSERARSKDTLWLQVVPRKLSLTSVSKRTDAVSDEEALQAETMWFLMPSEWSFNIDHTWEDLSSVSGAIEQVASKVKSQFRTLQGEFGKALTHGDKADNPALYVNSTKRSFKVQFQFAVYNDTFNDVFVPVQNLVEYSCPEISGSHTQFEYPYVFRLQTYTGDSKAVDIISVRTVAISSVAPSYFGPWINGYPSRATVDVDFVDINPLYRSTLSAEKSKKITSRTKNSRLTGGIR